MIKINVDKQQLNDVLVILDSVNKGSKPVMKRAINKTLTGVRTDMVKESTKVYTAPATIIRKSIKKYIATISNLKGKTEAEHNPIPLLKFSASQTKKGVTLRVQKSKGRSRLYWAFIATMKSGHKGVFEREYTYGRKMKAKKEKLKYGKLPEKYRLPITELFGISAADMLHNEKVLNEVVSKADERFSKNLTTELNFELTKIK